MTWTNFAMTIMFCGIAYYTRCKFINIYIEIKLESGKIDVLSEKYNMHGQIIIVLESFHLRSLLSKVFSK